MKKFLNKILPIVYEGIKDKKTINVNDMSQWVIRSLIIKCPNMLNKKQIITLFQGEKIEWKEIKEYIA